MTEKVNYDDLICRYINQFDNTFSFLDRKKRDGKILLMQKMMKQILNQI